MADRVVVLSPGMEGAWTRYVEAHPFATLFHELPWRDVLQRTFGHSLLYLMALRDEEVRGVLPLAFIKSLFFGRSLISVPFGVYGGMLVDDADASESLIEAAGEALAEHRASYVELRHLHRPAGCDLPRLDSHSTFICELPGDPDDVLAKMPRKARAEARKARDRNGLRVESGPLVLDAFHRLFATNKRSLGSPIFPRSLFANIQEILGERCYTLTVLREGVPVAAVMNFIHRSTVMAYYSGAAEAANRCSANNLMYVAVMEDGVRRGMRFFDFGRSRKATGAFEFKRNQGFEPIELHYQILAKAGIPTPGLHAGNPRFDLARKVFRRLPFPLAEKLGSFVVKRMPV